MENSALSLNEDYGFNIQKIPECLFINSGDIFFFLSETMALSVNYVFDLRKNVLSLLNSCVKKVKSFPDSFLDFYCSLSLLQCYLYAL